MKNEVTAEKLLSKYTDYREGAAAITRMIVQNKLIPILASGTNGKNPPLYKRYRYPLKEVENKFDAELFALKFPLYFDPSWYLSHRVQLEKDAWAIEKLISFLEKDPDLSRPVSDNERSFQIFGQEKYLVKTGKRILENLNYDPALLNTYETYEPITYFYAQIESSFLLILENLDPFVSCRRILIEKKLPGILVYGVGKKIIRNFQDLPKSDIPWIRNSLAFILYLGDLDWEGIRIYESLQASYKDIKINLFMEGYLAMLEKARYLGFSMLPKSKEGQKPLDGTSFFNYFTEEQKEDMLAILNSGCYIPQEILNGPDYEKLLERLNHETGIL